MIIKKKEASMSNRQPLEIIINGEIYYKAEKAIEILQATYSGLRNQVIAGNIKKDFPAGSKQAYYRKKDVDKLASERNINAFFGAEDEEADETMITKEEAETISFTPATEADINDCINLNRELFTVSTNESNTTLFKRWRIWIQKNPEIVHVLKRNGELIGITTTLPFKPDSRKFEEILRGDVSILLGDVYISAEDIEEYKAGNHVQLYIAEIGIKPSLSKNLRRKNGARLIYRFMDTIVDLGEKGVIIDKITSVGATKSGIRLLQHFGFSEITFSRSDTRVFIIDMKNSGAPLIRAYREALQNFTNLK